MDRKDNAFIQESIWFPDMGYLPTLATLNPGMACWPGTVTVLASLRRGANRTASCPEGLQQVLTFCSKVNRGRGEKEQE